MPVAPRPKGRAVPHITTIVRVAMIALWLTGCATTTDASRGRTAACTASSFTADADRPVRVRLQPSDSHQRIVRNCVTMIVTYGEGSSSQTVAIAEVFDPASGAIQITANLRRMPVSTVLFYWNESVSGAKRAFVFRTPPTGPDWNAVFLGWDFFAIGSDVYEYESAGYATLP